MKPKKKKIVAVLLSFGILLTGCSTNKEDTITVPVLEISESEKLSYSEWEDIPYSDSLAIELQRIATELNISPIKTLTYLWYSDNECQLTFDYNENLAYGGFVLEEEEWKAVFVVDAKTAEIYWTTKQESDLPFWIKKQEN